MTIRLKKTEIRRGKVEVVISKIDKTAPSISGDAAVNAQTATIGQDVRMTVSAKASDTESGVDKITYELYKGNQKIQEQQIASSSIYTFKAEKNITYNIKMYAIDKAGNTSNEKTIQIEQLNYLDTEAGKKDLNDETEKCNSNLEVINNAIGIEEEKLKNVEDSYSAERRNLDSTLEQQLRDNETEKTKNLENVDKKMEDAVNALTEEKNTKLAQATKRYEDTMANANKDGLTSEQINTIKEDYKRNKEMIQSDYEKRLDSETSKCEQEKNDINQVYIMKRNKNQEEYIKKLQVMNEEFDSRKASINDDKNSLITARESIINSYNIYKSNLEKEIYINIVK